MAICIEFCPMTSLDANDIPHMPYMKGKKSIFSLKKRTVRGPFILVCGPWAVEGQSSTVYELTE